MKNTTTIPSVDLRDFLSEDYDQKYLFVNALGQAFGEIGFVALKGHFLDKELMDDLYTQVKAFFSLPIEVKTRYEIEGIGGQRGYTSFGKEHAKDQKVADLKEFWHLGQQLPENSRFKGVYPENVEVEEIPTFNEIGISAYKMLEKTGIYVLRALALYLNLDECYFDQYVEEGNSILRSIYYPPIQTEPEDAVRAAEHTDINLITLLMGAQGKGLQVQNHQGEWIDAIAKPGELMINVGDMLSRHSNNKLISTNHRVVNPPREKWHESRFSVPFFVHPVSDMPLDCLETCVDESHTKLYEDITAGEFLDQRLREIGLKE